jgi:hypothetical protein
VKPAWLGSRGALHSLIRQHGEQSMVWNLSMEICVDPSRWQPLVVIPISYCLLMIIVGMCGYLHWCRRIKLLLPSWNSKPGQRENQGTSYRCCALTEEASSPRSNSLSIMCRKEFNGSCQHHILPNRMASLSAAMS